MSVSDISGDILLMTITKSEVGLFRAFQKVALPNFSFSRRLRLCSSAGKRSGSFPAVLLRPLITMLCPSFSRFFSLSVSFRYTELSNEVLDRCPVYVAQSSGHHGHGGGLQWTCLQAGMLEGLLVSINTFSNGEIKNKKVIFKCSNLHFGLVGLTKTDFL